jgi:hypothetical protein
LQQNDVARLIATVGMGVVFEIFIAHTVSDWGQKFALDGGRPTIPPDSRSIAAQAAYGIRAATEIRVPKLNRRVETTRS